MEDKMEVSDLVMMSDITEESMMNILKERFNKDKIYTLIRDVVISVNPYKKLDIYTEKDINKYRGKNIYELPPHIYTVADSAFLNIREQGRDQCIIISGESGAGKTEASKLIMEYIATVSGSSTEVDKVKNKLLESNPILEAFGNAKTTRNDNSSRFGKYMDLEFDFLGNPIGGHITTYLLEKSRVVNPAKDERSFHIFYHLLGGADKNLLDKLHLTKIFEDYAYLKKSRCTRVLTMEDKTQFETIVKALDCIGFTEEEKDTLFNCISAVLHIGNIIYKKDESSSEKATIENLDVCKIIAELLGVELEDLVSALTFRTVIDKSKNSLQKNIKTPLNYEKALSCQDTLAKTLYEKLFLWLVSRINSKIIHKEDDGSPKYVIGVLDIYGFEIFKQNGFEQFTINYCNEKLQQLFIELTLKLEQEEYNNEGIEWENVDYFNNKDICNLIESKSCSVISLLNEECRRPGDKSDLTFLDKLNTNLKSNNYYDSREKNRSNKEMNMNMFKIKHYAGDVIYTVDGFIEKNNDLLYNDVSNVMNTSSNPFIREMFPQDMENLKTPETISTQFKNSMNQLIKNLTSKTPHYIRCIKPNNNKEPDLFDENLCLHQCKYLGLLENIKVRRAGYCYRKEFNKFIERFKLISRDTWPHWKGDPQEGVEIIVREAGLTMEDFCIGKTKIFIKKPQMIFNLEEIRKEKENNIATIIRARWLSYAYRKKYLKDLDMVTMVQSTIRTKLEVLKYRDVVKKIICIQKNWRGHYTRKNIKKEWLKNPKFCVKLIWRQWKYYCARKMIRSMSEACKNASHWNKVHWPDETYETHKYLKDSYQILKNVHTRLNCRNYRKSLTPERKEYLVWKNAAMDNFKGKASWSESLKDQYTKDGLKMEENSKWKKICTDNSKVVQSFDCTKFHRRKLSKEVPRKFVVTENDLYLITDGIGLKDKIPFANISEIGCSTKKDGIIIFHTSETKGDLMIRTDNKCIEAITQIYLTAKKKGKDIKITINDNQNFKSSKATLPVEFANGTDKLSVVSEKDKIVINVPN